MGLADELKTLQELHEKGKLTDQEYTDAKTGTLRNEAAASGTHAKPSFMTWRVMVLLAILLLFLGSVWHDAGTGNTTKLIATAVHAPLSLTDEVENLPASSWKAVGLNLPYSGTVNINLQVVHGNPVDVFLTTVDQVDAMNRQEWNNVKAYGDFNATKTQTYRRTGQLGQGSYYLVMRDTSLGILSSSASDISVKVQLNP